VCYPRVGIRKQLARVSAQNQNQIACAERSCLNLSEYPRNQETGRRSLDATSRIVQPLAIRRCEEELRDTDPPATAVNAPQRRTGMKRDDATAVEPASPP
jgi:hypothetical protein